MKSIIISVGQNIKSSSFSDLIKTIDHHLDSGKYGFEGFIVVTDNEFLPIENRGLLKDFIDYAESNLGMLFNVLFTRKDIPVSTLEIVKNCERFFFLDEARVTKDVRDKENSSLSEKILGSESVESVNALKFRGFDEFSFQDVRQVYFGLDKIEMMYGIIHGSRSQKEFEVFGDIDSFAGINIEDLREDTSEQKKSRNAA